MAGYTDNVAISGALQKKFPSNKELSDARANSAAQALRDGGVSSNLSAAGHGDSNPDPRRVEEPALSAPVTTRVLTMRRGKFSYAKPGSKNLVNL